MKIRNKISISFLVTAVVIVIPVVMYLYIHLKNTIEGMLFDVTNIVMRHNTQEVGELLNIYKCSVNTLAHSVILEEYLKSIHNNLQRGRLFNYAMRRLKRHMKQTPACLAISVFNADGKVLVSTKPELLNVDKSSEMVFIYPKEHKDVYIEEIYNKEGGIESTIIILSAPMFDDRGKFIGVVAEEVNLLNSLEDIVESPYGPICLYILNRNGNVVVPYKYRFRRLDIKEGRRYRDAYLVKSYEGKMVLRFFEYIQDIGWHIIGEIDIKEFYSPLRKEFAVRCVAVVVVLIIVWVIGILVSKGITDNIYRLQNAFRLVKEGEFDKRVEIKSKDEISQLIKDFYIMVDDLKEKSVSIDRLREEMEARRLAQEELRRKHVFIENQLNIWSQFIKSDFLIGNIDDVIKRITETISITLDIERVSVWTFDDKKTKIFCIDLYEKTKKVHSKGIELYVAEYPSYFKALEKERIIIADDANNDPKTKEFSETYLKVFGITSMMDFPIYIGGRLAGILCSEHVGSMRHWTIEEQNFIGSMLNILILALEIEEHKKMGAFIKDIQAQLIHSEKLSAIGRMAASVAHEIKNPLAVILQGVEYLENNVGHAIEKKVLSLIKDSVLRADSIVRRILEFSKKKVLNRIPEDIHDILDSAIKLVELEFSKGKVGIVKNYGDGLPKVLVDKNQMIEVFVNIFLNSIEAMKSNAEERVIIINTSLRDFDRLKDGVGRKVSDFFVSGEKAVVIDIIDNGCGISKENLDKIFEPFFSTKQTESGLGVGLGLPIVRTIIDSHEGLIDIASPPEGRAKGVQVTITLKTAG